MLFIYMSFRFYGKIKLPLLQNDYVMIPLLKGSFYKLGSSVSGALNTDWGVACLVTWGDAVWRPLLTAEIV